MSGRSMLTCGLLVLAALAALTDGLPAARAGDWPQWRGPGRDGVWRQEGLPETLPKGGPQVLWRRPLGGGFGGIAATGGRVFVMDRQKEPREVERVVCFDAATGETLWTFAYPVTYGKLDYGNGPRATPTVHDGRVYTFGALGRLTCLETATGKELWSRDTVKDFQGRVPTWGHACSPLIDGDRLIVQAGGDPDACLVALDRRTGKEVWRGLSSRPGYSSPVLMTLGGQRQLVYWAAERLAGLEPATGRPVWQVPHTTNYDVTITDPVEAGGVVLVSDYWEGSKAVRPEGADARVVWQGRRLSQLMATPLVRDGHVYALDRHKGLKCVELATGTVKWEDARVTPRDHNPQASLVWAGAGPRAKSLILNAKGELVLAELTPAAYREVGRAKIIEDTWAHPGFLDGKVFARGDREIVCVSLADH